MKPRNFPGRKLRRQLRALRRFGEPARAPLGGSVPDPLRPVKVAELAALRVAVPDGYIEDPKDIRVRRGRLSRAMY